MLDFSFLAKNNICTFIWVCPKWVQWNLKLLVVSVLKGTTHHWCHQITMMSMTSFLWYPMQMPCMEHMCACENTCGFNIHLSLQQKNNRQLLMFHCLLLYNFSLVLLTLHTSRSEKQKWEKWKWETEVRKAQVRKAEVRKEEMTKAEVPTRSEKSRSEKSGSEESRSTNRK